jgi:hypothetical protein
MTPAPPLRETICRPLIENPSFWFDGSIGFHYAVPAFHQRTMNLSHAYVLNREFPDVQDPSNLVPDGFETQVVTDLGGAGSLLATKGAGTILIQWFGKAHRFVTVSANRLEEVEHWITLLQSRHPVADEPDRCDVRTWRLNRYGNPESTTSKIDSPTWASVRRNYSANTRAAIDSLAGLDDPVGGPRLILWYGEPGTGKTSAIRALAREWSQWCQLQILAEPEALVRTPGYLDAAMTTKEETNSSSDPTRGERQRLLVMEDCDAVLGGRRDDVGPALSRLLNSTDGLSEHGRRTLVLMTTNNPVHHLHPALVRPGRCRAIVEFTALSESESNQWLPDPSEPVTGPHTIAQLFVAAGHIDQIATEPQRPQQIGFS